MWWPGQIPAGAKYDEMLSHIDCWATLAKMAGLTPPATGPWIDNNGQPIYFDRLTTARISSGRKALCTQVVGLHRRRKFHGARVDIAGDPENPNLNIVWKYLWTAKDTWLG
jgi:arylsulfatase